MKKMFKSKSGQQIFIGIMTSVLVFIALVQLLIPLKSVITDARTSMSCGTAGLSTGTASVCILLDWYLPYFLAAGIAVSVGFITQKRFVTVNQ
jgi:hypothetical protein